MDECTHGDYAEEGWRCVDEALSHEHRLRYWSTNQQRSLERLPDANPPLWPTPIR